MVRVSNPEVRAARKFLVSKKLHNDIPARKFSMCAKELDCSFKDTLKYLANERESNDGRNSESEGGEYQR